MRFPKNILPEAKREAKKLIKEYRIEDAGGLQLIVTFASAYSLELECQKILDEEGLTVSDRFEQPKVHPLLAVQRDARSQKMLALKSLNLDLEPLKNQGRPGDK